MNANEKKQESYSMFDFDGIRLTVASPDRIREWSYGEVTRPETINYRTQKPEKDGLFSENIFGPSKDWECYCGKYKKIKYKGIVCDKCGVEVTRAIVRRERMGHIDLAAPVSHIWFLKGVPSKVGTLLDISVQALEKVIYFASFIITDVNEDLRKESFDELKKEYKAGQKQIDHQFSRKIEQLKEKDLDDEALEKQVKDLQTQKQEQLDELEISYKTADTDLKELKPLRIISEYQYQQLSMKYGHIFNAGIGAEGIRGILETLDLEKLIAQLERELKKAVETKKEKIIRRLKLANNLLKNKVKPEWMILTTIPVIPPDLRPVIALDGGRFATSDLNDLYRRVINRNNRLKHLRELNAPEVIVRNEKRMLQEAVDALIDNSARHGKTVMAATGQKRSLKSIADLLKGKQGRFRANLLGKRVDYSGRSVIVVGPQLDIHECGLPKKMAIELFKPFIISQLIKREYVHNVRSATRYIEAGKSEVWDILEYVIKDAHVLLNRAPTLHRLGIQAFKPLLIEGKAIQVHPLVCAAFNADFDGDQMAVHVPLSEEAKREARELMIASRNLLKPAHGSPVATPSQDIVWGIFYLTSFEDDKASEENIKIFADESEALTAYGLGHIRIRQKVKVRVSKSIFKQNNGSRIIVTTVGRIIFNQALPMGVDFRNEVMDKGGISKLIQLTLEHEGIDETAKILDVLKNLGFKYLTQSGNSLGMDDFPKLVDKPELLKEAKEVVDQITMQYNMGLLTDEERHFKVIQAWTEARDKITKRSREIINDIKGPVYDMIESGARGSWAQLVQIVGMKGLVTNPAGDIIDLPVIGNFKDGVEVLEFFISTHGARKGLTDTALRTANAGYLTRRLVDVAQDVITTLDDCGDTVGMKFSRQDMGLIVGEKLLDKFVGRNLLQDVKDKDGHIVLKSGDLLTEQHLRELGDVDVEEIHVRSVMSCQAKRGVCIKCYGYDLAYNQLVKKGLAVGIIAAQSIGEPGTQLTMRTFHTGGVAGADITQGLPRVEELFEVRPPKRAAFMTDVAGKVSILEVEKTLTDKHDATEMRSNISQKRIINIAYEAQEQDEYVLPGGKKKIKVDVLVKDGQKVSKGDVLYKAWIPKSKTEDEEITELSNHNGVVSFDESQGIIHVKYLANKIKEFLIPPGYSILVEDGQQVQAGDALTEGSLDLQTLYRFKGKEATQKYVISEIQYIYASQGQKLNTKHLEVMTKQMFSRVYVRDSGDSELLPGEIVECSEYFEALDNLSASDKKPIVEELLLGISRVSLTTKSFLSAASFIETQRVLTNAAISGKVDPLDGLKENVIIGRLIPAGTGYREI